jgi:hypothetical protein
MDTKFDVAYEGQHAFSILGCKGTVLCRVSGHGTYGDGVYIGAGSVDTIVCESRFSQIGRNGCSTTSASGVLFSACDFVSAARTTFNLEVHPGEVVEDYEVSDCRIDYHGLNMITSTGSGDSVNVAFRDLSLTPSRRFNAEVYGTGWLGRVYGRRINWTFERISGGMAHLGRDNYIKLYNIEGLSVIDCPYPMQTAGSTLTPVG